MEMKMHKMEREGIAEEEKGEIDDEENSLFTQHSSALNSTAGI